MFLFFGSYITTRYEDGKSDIYIAIYADDFELYLQISTYVEEYFNQKGIESDIFYIDMNMEAPFYCAPLNSQIQFTDYYPQKLAAFKKNCQNRLDEINGADGWFSFFKKIFLRFILHLSWVKKQPVLLL